MNTKSPALGAAAMCTQNAVAVPANSGATEDGHNEIIGIQTVREEPRAHQPVQQRFALHLEFTIR